MQSNGVNALGYPTLLETGVAGKPAPLFRMQHSAQMYHFVERRRNAGMPLSSALMASIGRCRPR